MNSSQYLADLNNLQQLSFGNMLALAKWTRKDGLPWLWQELSSLVYSPKLHHPAQTKPAQKQAIPLSSSNAVRSGLIINPFPTPPKSRYFVAQMTMLDAEAKKYCAQIDKFASMEPAPYVNACAHSLHEPLSTIMQFGINLLHDAGQAVSPPRSYGAWWRNHDNPLEVFNGVQQMIYSPYSGLAHADRVWSMPAATLRVAIELRLRHAFCIYAMVNSASPHLPVFIDMSKLFDAMRPLKQYIKFATDIDDVEKIYQWSNLYLHGGRRDYPWVAGFVLHYIRPILTGEKIPTPKGFHINAGIQIPPRKWRDVRKGVSALYTLHPGGQALKLPSARLKQAQCIFI